MDLRVNQRRRNYKLIWQVLARLRHAAPTLAAANEAGRCATNRRCCRSRCRFASGRVNTLLSIRQRMSSFAGLSGSAGARASFGVGWRRASRSWNANLTLSPSAGVRVFTCGLVASRLRTHSLQDYQRLSHYALGYQIPTSGPGLIFVPKHWPERRQQASAAWLYMTYR